jgi:flavin reductase (DIM6/NTAB) family NADH-FMN oxidoreductase RutF
MTRLNIADLKEAMSAFVTGVCVVTTQLEGSDYGMTCNSFNIVSLEPPLVMWSIRQSSASFPAFAYSKGYVVNVLSDSQQEQALKFTQGSHAERFAGVDTCRMPNGIKRLNGVIAWFDCTLQQVINLGDHAILIGNVNAVSTHEGVGLAYARRQFGLFKPQILPQNP